MRCVIRSFIAPLAIAVGIGCGSAQPTPAETAQWVRLSGETIAALAGIAASILEAIDEAKSTSPICGE